MSLSTVNTSRVQFPYEIDTYKTIPLVFNGSESSINYECNIYDHYISIKVDYSNDEKWSEYGGYIHIDDEDMYYSHVKYEYFHVKSIISLSSLFRNSGNYIEISPMVPNCINIQNSKRNSVMYPLKMYTMTGALNISNGIVDFCVYEDDNGQTRFVFSDTSMINVDGCSVDYKNGTISIDTNGFDWHVEYINFGESYVDKKGGPIRRVSKLCGLVRGINKTIVANHKLNSVVRGFIHASHISNINESIEKIVDRLNFIDDEINVVLPIVGENTIYPPPDDYGCPDVVMHSEKTIDKGAVVGYNFIFDVYGARKKFKVDFGDGIYVPGENKMYYEYSAGEYITPKVIAGDLVCSYSNQNSSSINEDKRDNYCPPCISIFINVPKFDIDASVNVNIQYPGGIAPIGTGAIVDVVGPEGPPGTPGTPGVDGTPGMDGISAPAISLNTSSEAFAWSDMNKIWPMPSGVLKNDIAQNISINKNNNTYKKDKNLANISHICNAVVNAVVLSDSEFYANGKGVIKYRLCNRKYVKRTPK